MAWESRRHGRYFYLTRRVGERTRTEYFGNGDGALLAARYIAQQRAGRTAERQSRARWQVLERQMCVLDTGCNLLIEAALTAAGYYRHDRGPWRRRRAKPTT